jgi:hypothetical protein
LTALLDQLIVIEPSWETMRPTLDALTTYAVEFRYPGASANQLLANQAFHDCCEIRLIIRQHLSC